MDSSHQPVLDLPTYLRVYKDGRVERLRGTVVLPPSVDLKTGVSSKDVDILPELGVSARLYLPKLAEPCRKLPILVYYHGGGFVIQTPFSPLFHPYLNSLVSEANVVAVSVHYRRAPEHPLPAAHSDAWAALQWTASHANGGPEAWLRDYGDFTRLFVGGDDAGGNITHNVTMYAGTHELGHGVKIYGAILVQPYFWGVETISKKTKDPVGKARMDSIWMLSCPSTTGVDDPLINPMADEAPSLSGLSCKRVLVCVAENDALRDRGWRYYRSLGSCGWDGTAEIFETEGEDHVFHLFNPSCEKAAVMMKRLADFLNL